MADFLFTLYLLVVFPLHAVWRSLRQAEPKPKLMPLQAYWRQGRFVLALLAVFIAIAWWRGHTPQELGLAMPPGAAGMWGLVIAGVLIVALCVADRKMVVKPEQHEKAAQTLRDLPFAMPRTRVEFAVYALVSVSMTTAWEVLFRGYLLLVLTPHTGVVLAVVLASVAYGAAHGYDNARQFLSSIAMAFAFTIGYVATDSLWWLIILHAAAPLTMPFAARRVAAGVGGQVEGIT